LNINTAQSGFPGKSITWSALPEKDGQGSWQRPW
jgi:hypothetical protein